MGLDKINIGARIRKIREDIFHETRQLLLYLYYVYSSQQV